MRALLWIVVIALVVTACAASPPAVQASGDPPPRTIDLVSHGWHTGIVIRLRDLPPDAWPEIADFPNTEYVEVGWGDRDFYQAPEPGAWLALKAALIPGPGVLHLVSFRLPAREYFPSSEVIALKISDQGLERLVAYVRATYERDPSGKPIRLGVGLYGDSSFYASSEKFHLFNDCNSWTARALRASGIPVGSHFTAGALMDDARDIAQRQRAPQAQSRVTR